MTKYTQYKICLICFTDIVESSNFTEVAPFVLIDEPMDISYILDESVPCDSLKQDSDIESICSIQNNA